MQWSSVCLVRSNAATLARYSNNIADAFLDRLVRQCPELAKVLTWDREQRRRELQEGFAAIVRYAGNTQALSARLAVVAASNSRRGLRRDHYERGRDVLLALLQEFNGPSWGPGLAGAWAELLDSVLIQLCPPLSFEEALAA